MSIFKVGDKVRIVKKVDSNYGAALWVTPMDKTIGNIGTVIGVTPREESTFYNVDFGNKSYNYWEDALAKAEFACDDIREFDIVELRNGQKRVIIEIGCNLTVGTLWLENWEDGLYWTVDKIPDDYDIMKVYRPIDSIPTDKSKWKDLPMIWEREEVKELTVAEISKILGYKIKVVE